MCTRTPSALRPFLPLHKELSVHGQKTPLTEFIYLLLSLTLIIETRSFPTGACKEGDERQERGLPSLSDSVPQDRARPPSHQLLGTRPWSKGPGEAQRDNACGFSTARAHVLPQETCWQTARCRHSGMSALSNHTPLLGYLLVKMSLHVSACCWNVRTRMERTSGKDLRSFPMGPNQTERLCGIRARSMWRGWGCEGAQGTWGQVRGGESSA